MANQPPPLADYDALACDPALTAALAREGAGAALPALKHLAALVASAEAREHARLADVHPPVLHTHDRYGHRIDEVEFHPSWHWLMRRAVGSGPARRAVGGPRRARARTSRGRPGST